jgi:hypothetical protein
MADARPEPGRERDGDDDTFESGRPKLTNRDTWRLIFATYRESFPYLLVFILGMLAATWLVTVVLF